MAIEKGQTYRIVTVTVGCCFCEGDNDFYGLPVGTEFTIQKVDDSGDGWCKPVKGMAEYWMNHNDICILTQNDIARGSVVLVP